MHDRLNDSSAGALRSVVPAGAAGAPLGDWLARRFTYLDASEWRVAIAAGQVRRNGAAAHPAVVLEAGDEITYHPPGAAQGAGTDVEVAVLHDDGDLVAIDKPAGLVAHRDGAFVQNTFLRALERRVHAMQPLHLVHRLDRHTSGVLLLARRPDVVAAVQRQFTAGTATKEYCAIVHGCVAADTFTIDAPIGPATDSAIAARRAVCAGGTRGARAARTDVAVVERFAAHTLLAVTPRTGRTHQIRVHLAHAGHPIAGDELYGRTDAEYLAHVQRCKAGERPAARQLLHAARLRIVHPATGDTLTIDAPTPDDLRRFVATSPRQLPPAFPPAVPPAHASS